LLNFKVKYLRAAYFLTKNYLKNYPSFAALELMGTCNNNCPYCSFAGLSNGQKDLADDDWYHIVDEFIKRGVISFSFIGREPFLRKDLLFKLIHRVRNKAITGVVTNGILVTSEDIIQMKELGLDYFQLSVHSLKDLQRNLDLTIEARKIGLVASLSMVVYSKNMNLWRKLIKACQDNEIIFNFCLCQQLKNSQTTSYLIKDIISPSDLNEVLTHANELFRTNPGLIRNSRKYINSLKNSLWHCDPEIFARLHINYRGEFNACTAFNTGVLFEDWVKYQVEAIKVRRSCQGCNYACEMDFASLSNVVRDIFRVSIRQ